MVSLIFEESPFTRVPSIIFLKICSRFLAFAEFSCEYIAGCAAHMPRLELNPTDVFGCILHTPIAQGRSVKLQEVASRPWSADLELCVCVCVCVRACVCGVIIFYAWSWRDSNCY